MNYENVKNTAKNGKLIRAELRELVLAEALCYGLIDKDKFTELPIPDTEQLHSKNDPLSNVYKMNGWVIAALRYHYNYSVFHLDNEPYCPAMDIFYFRSKKFRHYRKRLEYGPEHYWRLRKNIMRYMWTKAPLVLFFAEAEVPGSFCLDFTLFEFAYLSYSLEENMQAISEYISRVCGIKNHYRPEQDYFRLYFDSADYELLVETVKAEGLKLKQKLYDGCYIGLTKAQKSDIRKGYDYGKKTRSKLRDLARRQAEKNQEPA